MPAPIDSDTRAAVLDAIHAGELSRAAIARAHRVSRSTVTKIARDNGVEGAFDRTNTKKATAAAKTDHAARLVALAARHAKLAEAILDSFDAMNPHDWADTSPHTRGVVLGIASDKARDLAPPDDGANAAGTEVASVVELIRRRYG